MNIEELGDEPFRVDATGHVTLPLVGRLQVIGLTTGEIEGEINQRLTKFIKNPAVSVTVTEVQNHPISVIGAVQSSAVYQMAGSKTLIEMLSSAGGPRTDAGDFVVVTRPVASGPLPLPDAALDSSEAYWVGKVELAPLLSGKRPETNIRLMANDVVSVQKADLVYVVGDVNHAGAIPVVGRLTLTEALARAEGLQKSASRKNVRILRENATKEGRTETVIDFQKVLTGKIPDVELHANDVVVIPTNLSRSAALRALDVAVTIGTGLIIWR